MVKQSRGARILSKITNVGFLGKPVIFFYFCDLDFIDYLNFGWYSQKCWQNKIKLWWYSWKAKKKLKPPGAQAGPKRGPSLGTRWF